MTRTFHAVISASELAGRLGLPQPTPEQAAIIEAPPEAAVVLAGAGSGKTETMAARVVWLVANELVNPDAVLGLTFTRKAAAELGARVRRRLRAWANHADPDQRAALRAAEPTVATYAAYCARLVNDHGLRLGLEPGTRLLSPAAAWQLADSAVRRYAGELDDDIGTPPSVVRYVLQLAAELSDHLQSVDSVEHYTDALFDLIETLPLGPRTVSDHPGALKGLVRSARHRRQLLPIVRAFQQDKAHARAADFADYMVWAAGLSRLVEVQQAERGRYRTVLLDEYQDTGHAQIELLRNLYGHGHSVTAVGDPFQSIYSWRGASSGNISRFTHDFASTQPAQEFTLATSWRNDRAILTAANGVARPLRAAQRATVELRPRVGAPTGAVHAAFLDTVESEAEWVAGRVRTAWEAMTGARTAAVLVRRRSQIPVLADAIRAVGLPVEIVGLGGLLTTPEVADVVATLQVLADHDPGPALLRILTGPRWRIGPRDLVALAGRGRELAAVVAPTSGASGSTADITVDMRVDITGDMAVPVGAAEAPNGGSARVRREPGSIVEAIDDLGPPTRFSAVGYQRLTALAEELRRLRRRVSAPLPDLVAEVERTTGIDIEVTARTDRSAVGRAHPDRFLDAAADFSGDSDQATLTAFLAYLGAAEDEENGLPQAEIEVETDRVQILTVHGAKGLEWDAVAVPGLDDDVFPSAARNHDWTRARQLLPSALRGDARDLPQLDVRGVQHRRELAGRIKAAAGDPPDDLESALKQVHLLEERRLAYVACTRARSTLIASGYAWDLALKARSPSPFLVEIAEHATMHSWFEPEPDSANPHDATRVSFAWPYDPLGDRRQAVSDGAALVRSAMAHLGSPRVHDAGGETADAPESLRGGSGRTTDSAEDQQWRRDVEILLAERAAARSAPTRDVELPARLSVSQLVLLHEDPSEFARRLTRPLPLRPAPLARRGTAFHLWLERRWQGEHLIDLDDLPGAADDSAVVDVDLNALQAAFAASEWATRTPYEIEVPFEMVIGAVVVRGRMDAVFQQPADETGRRRWLVVDWKTGAQPHGEHARAAAVQLAAYRLAWQRIVDTEAAPVALDQVGAAFHYVLDNATVAPNNVLDEAGLRRLIERREQ